MKKRYDWKEEQEYYAMYEKSYGVCPCMVERNTMKTPSRWNREERPEMHLLLVEDERALARAVSVILERKGHDVDVANDGDEGHDAIANGSYDGIVMDIMMPGRSGTELLSEMRAAGNETPVLLLTAKTSLDDKVSGLELGADD